MLDARRTTYPQNGDASEIVQHASRASAGGPQKRAPGFMLRHLSHLFPILLRASGNFPFFWKKRRQCKGGRKRSNQLPIYCTAEAADPTFHRARSRSRGHQSLKAERLFLLLALYSSSRYPTHSRRLVGSERAEGDGHSTEP